MNLFKIQAFHFDAGACRERFARDIAVQAQRFTFIVEYFTEHAVFVFAAL